MASRREGSFVAVDSDANEYTVIMYRDLVNTTTLQSRVPTHMRAALGELRTSDGRCVNRIEKGTYEIVGRPMIRITSDDPNAP